MPSKYEIKSSLINGNGLFSKINFKKDDFIEVGIYLNEAGIFISEAGKYVNHSDTPNAFLKQEINYNLVALKDININDEITVSYNDDKAPALIKRYDI